MTAQSGSPSFENRSADWLGLEEAQSRIFGQASPLEAHRISIAESVGHALAEQLIATATLPPWDNSAMDGYAVRAEDIERASRGKPAKLTVIDVVRAGQPTAVDIGPRQAVRIMTGAPIPRGADTVIRVEDTDAEADPGVVRILESRDRGRHIRAAGQDMREGESLLPPGHSITPGTTGLLAAAGCETVLVYRRPTVGILTTGDELRRANRYEDVRAGRGIPDSNGPMLAAMTRAAGGIAVDLGIAGDTPEDLMQRIHAGMEWDVLLTIGGASMGDADLVKRVLDDLAFHQDFWRVRMRPGSPFSFGWLPDGEDRQPVFGLPGNPASAFVTFEVFVRPFLLALAGHRRTLRRRVTCRSGDTFRAPAQLTHFQRVALSDSPHGVVASVTGSQGSGLVSGLARADGLAVIPEGVEVIEPGGEVEVMLLDDAPGGSTYDTASRAGSS